MWWQLNFQDYAQCGPCGAVHAKQSFFLYLANFSWLPFPAFLDEVARTVIQVCPSRPNELVPNGADCQAIRMHNKNIGIA